MKWMNWARKAANLSNLQKRSGLLDSLMLTDFMKLVSFCTP